MINIGSLIATLGLQDKLTPALKRAEGNLKKTGAQMTKFGGQMQATGMKMTMGLTVPIVGGMAAAAIAFGGFEKSMNRVKALTGATGKDFKLLKDQAKDLGKKTKFSAGEAAEAMGFLGMAGFKTTEIYGAMPSVLELAAAATLDVASAADITSNIMTGFGQTTEDLAHTNNVLVKAFTSANTDLTQLGVAFKYAGPVAKSAGLSFESTAAAIAMMGNAGIQGSMAGTALRGAVVKLLGPTSKASREMRNLGLNVTDSTGKIKPMDEIVRQLGDSSATTEQLITIFGVRAGPAMAALVGQGADALKDFTVGLEGVGNIAEEIAATQMEGLAGTFTLFQSASTGALIEIGEKLAPILTSFLEMGIRLSNWVSDSLVPAFANLSPLTQKLIIGFVAFLAALGPLLMVIGHVALGVGALTLALGGYAATATTATTKTSFLTRAMVALNKTFLARGVKAFFAPAIAFLSTAVSTATTRIKLFTANLLINDRVQKIITATTLFYKNAVIAMNSAIGGGKKHIKTFIAWLTAKAVAMGISTAASITLTGALTALWIVTGVGLIVIAAIAAAFALWKFAKWIAGILNLGAAWLKVKGALGLLNVAEKEAAERAAYLGREVEDLEAKTEVLKYALSKAALSGTVEELEATMLALSQEMANQGEQAYKDEEAMEILMDGIRRLDSEGVTLNATWTRMIEEEKKLAKDAAVAAQEIEEQRKATEGADEATQKWAEDVESLRQELSGAGLADELQQLEEAYAKLTPAQKANEDVMRRMIDASSSLTDEGVELAGSLRDYIIETREAIILTEGIARAKAEAADEAEKFTKDLKALTDRMGDRGLARDTELAVLMFKEFEDATVRTSQDTERLGKFFVDIRDRGGDLTAGMLELADAYEATKNASGELHDAHVKTWEDLNKLADSLDPAAGLPGDITDLENVMQLWEAQDRLTSLSLIELGNAALKLEARGATLTPNLLAAADAAREVKAAGSESKESLEKLARAFEQLANIAGGTFAGVARAIGTTIASMKVAGESGDAMKGSLDKIKGGDTLGGMADLATGVMGVVGALDAATSSGNKAQNVLGGMMAGAKAGAAFGPIGSAVGGAIGGIVGFIRSNGPSAMEKEARNLVDVFQDNVISNLNSSQLDEAKGRKWAQVIIGVRDAYLVAGKTAEEAEEIVGRLWEAIKLGPEAVGPLIEEIEGVTQAGIDAAAALKKVTDDGIEGLKNFSAEVLETGKALPASIQPYLESLLKAGLITEDDKAALMAMTDDAEINFAGMEAAANKYGIELSALGPKFASAEMEKAAEALSADWAILTENGADVNAVMDGMQDEVQELVSAALSAGQDIPLSMQPVIDSMVEQGRLTDENGVKLLDTSKINFAEPIAVKFDALITKIAELIDKLAGPGPDSATSATARLSEDLANIPDPDIKINFDVSDFPDLEFDPSKAGWGGIRNYAHGSGGYQDFGSGSLAMLHGKEKVVPLGSGEDAASVALLNEISGLRNELRVLPLHLRDAILLTN